jgi:hypothetical protein
MEKMMKLISDYVPPTPDDLGKLKAELKKTGEEMAELAGVAGNNQWRKYTGGEKPRSLNQHILFYMAAQLILDENELNKIILKMQEIGASFEFNCEVKE